MLVGLLRAEAAFEGTGLLPGARVVTPMALVIRERNGRWHVYENSTEPWALVTAFDCQEAAEMYCASGKIRTDEFDVRVGPWVPEVVQEDFKCVTCGNALWSGYSAYVRMVVTSGAKAEKRFEARCLHHVRTRFDREDPV